MEPNVTETTPEETIEEIAAPVEDATARLAEEFFALSAEFPHITDPAALPDGVLDTAAEEGISLLDAFLRHRWQEEKRVAAALQKQQEAAARSAGSLSRGATQTPPEQDAFLRAFRSAL